MSLEKDISGIKQLMEETGYKGGPGDSALTDPKLRLFKTKSGLIHIQYPLAGNQVSMCKMADQGEYLPDSSYPKDGLCKECVKLALYLLDSYMRKEKRLK